ncbi:MAG: hypothetical protein R2706_10825 [Acidimicrobiales bacterium]
MGRVVRELVVLWRLRGQPYAILLDGSGKVLGEWAGAIPEDEVLALIS